MQAPSARERGLAPGTAPTTSRSSPASGLPESRGRERRLRGDRCQPQGSRHGFLSAWQDCGQLFFVPILIPILIPIPKPGFPVRPSLQNEFSCERKDTIR